MICQNCNKNEANMHMKRIINGRAGEVHLCADCARSLGYGEAFSGFGLGFGNIFGEILAKDGKNGAGLVCPGCAKSFDEILADGKMGCAECYSVFYDKLLPSLSRIHGKSTYVGTRPIKTQDESYDDVMNRLKNNLYVAIETQNFELAAQIRDEINSLAAKRGEN